ncbi:hypothetical protein [Paenibacillus polymyxa]|uniref:hypothetical protein n=1 Tax=Paenibacillus polymyxa TaxID=1406 RepID=UPI0020199B2D|nr:hypothetical protein [Paenibacillus polymyxa]UQQ35352.1 hypothetical protein LMH85_24670 [Paenibacillus polymyxa]
MLNNRESNPINLAPIRGMLGEFTQLFDQIGNEREKQLVHALIRKVTVTKDKKIAKVDLEIN